LGFDGHAAFILSRCIEANEAGEYSEPMTRAITEEEFVSSKSDLLKSVGRQTLLIQKDGETVAVLVSPQEYEAARKAKAERAIQAMDAFGQHMRSVTTPEELDALEKELHARAR
jgi:PHD/YefM family antitoxin component YafN of YafNO toxin-antitoxin module